MPDSDIEAAERQIAANHLQEENHSLREQLAVAEALAAQLRESLAVSGAEAEVFRRQIAELKLRLEALGVDGAGGADNKVAQRLLKAVNDLRLAKADETRTKKALALLISAIEEFIRVSTTEQPAVRMQLEVAVREARSSLDSSGIRPESDGISLSAIQNLTVIDYRDDLALLVINAGRNHGIKVGTPLQVLRGERVIATARVVDVRQTFAGAVVQYLNSQKEKISKGDRLLVDAQL